MKRSNVDKVFGVIGAILIAFGMYISGDSSGIAIVIGSALFFNYVYDY